MGDAFEEDFLRYVPANAPASGITRDGVEQPERRRHPQEGAGVPQDGQSYGEQGIQPRRTPWDAGGSPQAAEVQECSRQGS